MHGKYIFSSLTRISDLSEEPFEKKNIAKMHWETGDYVVCEVTRSYSSKLKAELVNGRMMELFEGDLLVGALGIRHASLEATGSWHAVGREGTAHLLTGAGLIGKLTSKSAFIPSIIELQYLGHVMRVGQKVKMEDFVTPMSSHSFQTPTILIIGTSMSSGKTTSAKIITRQLKKMGLKVAGAKLTGAGRYRDILSIGDSGADTICDFVDAGLPSSICSRDQYNQALHIMLSKISVSGPDVAVIEIGASPLEPYNGDAAVVAIKDHVVCTVLCASDPYAVLGIMNSFDTTPTLVTGPAVNTLGGAELVKKLSKLEALNLIERENLPRLRTILDESVNKSKQ